MSATKGMHTKSRRVGHIWWAGKHKGPEALDFQRCRIIDNRSYSGGVLVELIIGGNGYRHGEQLLIGPADFVPANGKA